MCRSVEIGDAGARPKVNCAVTHRPPLVNPAYVAAACKGVTEIPCPYEMVSKVHLLLHFNYDNIILIKLIISVTFTIPSPFKSAAQKLSPSNTELPII